MPPRRKERYQDRRHEARPDQDWYLAYRKSRGRDVEVRTFVLRLADELVDQIEGILRDLYVLAGNMGINIRLRGSKEEGVVRMRVVPSFVDLIDERLGYRFAPA